MTENVVEPPVVAQPEPVPVTEEPPAEPVEEPQPEVPPEEVPPVEPSPPAPEPEPEAATEETPLTEDQKEVLAEAKKAIEELEGPPKTETKPEETKPTGKLIKPKIPKNKQGPIATWRDYTEEEQEEILGLTSWHQTKEAFEGHPEEMERQRRMAINDWINGQVFKPKKKIKSIWGVFNPKNFHPKTKVDMAARLVGAFQTIVNVLLAVPVLFYRHPNAIVEIIVRVLILAGIGLANEFLGGVKRNLASYKETVLTELAAEVPAETTEEPASSVVDEQTNIATGTVVAAGA